MATTERAGARRAGPPKEPTATDTATLIEAHLPLVHQVIAELTSRFPAHVDRRELWNAGALGLVEAADRFDPSTGVTFGRYAAPRVRGAVLDATRQGDWASRGVRRGARQLAEASEALRHRLGREPSTDELADQLGIAATEVESRRADVERATVLHLDQPVDGEERAAGRAWTDLLQELDVDRLPETAVERREALGRLRMAVAHLPPRLREVVVRYYYRDHLLRDIAASLGVTEARVSQLRAEAIAALQAALGATVEASERGPGSRRRRAYATRVRELDDCRRHLDAAGCSVPELAARAS